MTERQRALAAYIRTLGPQMRGVRSVNQFVDRLMSCIREDGIFVASQFAQGLLAQGKQKADEAAPPALKALTDAVVSTATDWLRDLTKPPRKR